MKKDSLILFSETTVRKRFVYFHGMFDGVYQTEIYSKNGFNFILGWMDKDCEDSDNAMLLWMETAEVGASHQHRLGTLVRMKDELK